MVGWARSLWSELEPSHPSLSTPLLASKATYVLFGSIMFAQATVDGAAVESLSPSFSLNCCLNASPNPPDKLSSASPRRSERLNEMKSAQKVTSDSHLFFPLLSQPSRRER